MFKLWAHLVGKSRSDQQSMEEQEQSVSPAPSRTYHDWYPLMLAESERQGRPQVFDPALIPGLAIRLGLPELLDPEMKAVWHAARRDVVNHLLQLVTGSTWNDHLVLRGSLLLTAWLGKAARKPGDMDWVFRPIDVEINSLECQALFSDLVQIITEQPKVGRTTIQAGQIATKDIWTYQRAVGRRMIVPWLIDNTLPGEVQMDIVFGEELFSDPIQTPIPLSDGSRVVAWTANKEISLAWKLFWLATDNYPQGKDLYDATLLAEQTPLSLDLLHRVLKSEKRVPIEEVSPNFPMLWNVDWDNFKLELEYPWVEGEAIDWQVRLTKALAPLFEERTVGQ